MKQTMLSLVFAIVLGAFAQTAITQEQPSEAIDFVVIDTSEASESYEALFDKFTAFYKKQDSSAERTMWNNVYAGTESGQVILMIRYPNFEAVAQDNPMFDSPEYQALNEEFQAKGFKIKSESLMFRVR